MGIGGIEHRGHDYVHLTPKFAGQRALHKVAKQNIEYDKCMDRTDNNLECLLESRGISTQTTKKLNPQNKINKKLSNKIKKPKYKAPNEKYCSCMEYSNKYEKKDSKEYKLSDEICTTEATFYGSYKLKDKSCKY